VRNDIIVDAASALSAASAHCCLAGLFAATMMSMIIGTHPGVLIPEGEDRGCNGCNGGSSNNRIMLLLLLLLLLLMMMMMT